MLFNFKFQILNFKFIPMYTSSILWLLTWPLLLVAAYLLIRLALRLLEKRKTY